jgi:hypothetical protein
MNLFFKKINIPEPKWNLPFVIPDPGLVLYERHYTNIKEIVPNDLLEKLNVINMVPEYVRIFVWPKNFSGQWHIDGTYDLARFSCMNWIINGSGVIQFNSNIKLKAVNGVHRGSGGPSSPTDAIEEETTGHGYVINSGACHRIFTNQDGRTSISLGYKNKDVPFLTLVEKLSTIGLI